MTTQLRRDRQKGRAARPDGTFAVNPHPPHVEGARCSSCKPAGLTDTERALLAPQQRVPFRSPSMPLETIFDRLEGKGERPFAMAAQVQAALDKALKMTFSRRSQQGRARRQRSGR